MSLNKNIQTRISITKKVDTYKWKKQIRMIKVRAC